MKQTGNIMDPNAYFSDESRDEITYYVHQYMHQVRQGRPLREVIANILCIGDTPEKNAAMPDFYMESLHLSENNAYFLADHIIRRVCEQTDAACTMMSDGEEGVYELIDGMIDDLKLSDPKDLYRAVQRMHQLNESLRIVLPCVENSMLQGKPSGGDSVLPAYKGKVTPEALEQLKKEAAGRVHALSLSPDLLRAFRKELMKGGNTCATSKHVTKDSVALKSLSAAVIFYLSRSGNLPEVMDDVSIESIVAVTCLYSDLQMISDSVELGQRAYSNTKVLLEGAVGGAVLGLLIASIKTGALGVLISTLLAHPVTLILCIALVCVALPHVMNALDKLTEETAMRAADFAVAHEGMTFGDYVLPPLNHAKDKMVKVLEKLGGLFAGQKEAEPLTAAVKTADETVGVQVHAPVIRA